MTEEQQDTIDALVERHGRAMVEVLSNGYVRVTRENGLYQEIGPTGRVMVAGKGDPLPPFEG